MAYAFKLPDLGEGLTEGEVARWLVAEGDVIAEDDPLVEIQTDKTTVEIPSPAAGPVTRILVAAGEIVPVGTVLVEIGGAVAPAAPASDEPRIQATPLVRRLAEELGVDLAAVTGTGPAGRITEDDVRGEGQAPAGVRREPLRGVRRQIAEHLTRAHREIPAVTYVEECDFTDVDLAFLLPRVLKATAASLPGVPELNARFDGDAIVYLEEIVLGVAIQTDAGLVVPVMRDCESKSLEALREEIDELAGRARSGTLSPEELRGSTFSVTSAGKLAGLLVTPLINHPEVGILGIHRIAARPVVRDGDVTVRRIGNVSVTFDHRVVDGARAAAFALDVIARLETPA